VFLALAISLGKYNSYGGGVGGGVSGVGTGVSGLGV